MGPADNKISEQDLRILFSLLRQAAVVEVEDIAADTFFDIKKSDAKYNSNIEFLKNTKLKDISIETDEDPKFFRVRDTTTNQFIQFSNRQSTSGEIRGSILKSILIRFQNDHSKKELSLYDFLNEEIKTPNNLDTIKAFKGVIQNDALSQQIDFFVRLVLSQMQETIKENQHLTDKKAKEQVVSQYFSDDFLKKLYSFSADLGRIPGVQNFWRDIGKVEAKKTALLEQGFFEECAILDNYLETTRRAFFTFVQNEQGDDFRRTLGEASKIVEESVVGKNRENSLFGSIIKLIRNIIGLPPQSIQQIRVVWNASEGVIKEQKGHSRARKNISDVKQSISEARKMNENLNTPESPDDAPHLN